MKKLNVLVLMVACIFLLASCSKEADDRSAFSEFNEYILETVIENLETLSDGYFCFMGDGEIIVSSIADYADIIAILNWNPDTEKFMLD